MSQTIVFLCREKGCEKLKPFKDEVDLKTHYMFDHNMLLPTCGTNVAEKQALEWDRIRKEYRDVNRKIMSIEAFFRNDEIPYSFIEWFGSDANRLLNYLQRTRPSWFNYFYEHRRKLQHYMNHLRTRRVLQTEIYRERIVVD